MNDTVSGRIFMLNSINTAVRNVTVKPSPAKPCRTTDPIPRNWEGSNEKGEVRHFMSDQHLRMQAWSDEGETMLVSAESSDKLDITALSVDCTEESSKRSRRHFTKYCAVRQQTNHWYKCNKRKDMHAVVRIKITRGTCLATTQHFQHFQH